MTKNNPYLTSGQAVDPHHDLDGHQPPLLTLSEACRLSWYGNLPEGFKAAERPHHSYVSSRQQAGDYRLDQQQPHRVLEQESGGGGAAFPYYCQQQEYHGAGDPRASYYTCSGRERQRRRERNIGATRVDLERRAEQMEDKLRELRERKAKRDVPAAADRPRQSLMALNTGVIRTNFVPRSAEEALTPSEQSSSPRTLYY